MNHFETAEHYFKINQQHSTPFYKTRLYQTLGLAAYDLSFSLLQFLSHKPKIAILRQGSSVFESLIPIFLRQQTPIQFKADGQNTHQFIEAIDKETNFVLWSSENEITGEILFSDAKCQEIHKALSDKKIFSIQIVQRSRQINKTELLKNNYAVVIETNAFFTKSFVEVFMTEKMKAQTLIGTFQGAEFMPWALSEQNFELKKIFEFQYEKQFQPTVDYLKDRKTLLFKNCSGEMLMQKLVLTKSIRPDLVFAPSSLPTWVLDTFKNWWSEAQSTQLLLNMLVVSNEAFILNPNLEVEILNLYQTIQNQTTWSVS